MCASAVESEMHLLFIPPSVLNSRFYEYQNGLNLSSAYMAAYVGLCLTGLGVMKTGFPANRS